MENLINAGKVTMQLFYTGGPPLVRFFLGPKNRTIRGLPVRFGRDFLIDGRCISTFFLNFLKVEII